MKTLRITCCSLLAALCGLFTACDDYLLVESTSVRNISDFYSTPAELEQSLMGVYNGLLIVPYYTWFMSEVRSDNAWSGRGSTTARDYIEISLFNHAITELETLNDAWVDLYTIVARANILLDNQADVEITVDGYREQLCAEARFLRALAYFDLVRYFGRVPMCLEPLTVDEMFTVGQSEDEEIYEEVIIPDLLYAIENLTDEPIDYQGDTASEGRVTLQAAKALLGKVYLTMSGYPIYDTDKASLAEELLEEVIDYAEENDLYWAETGEEWQHIWISDNDNQYHIFEVQYIAESGYGNPMVYFTTPKVPTAYISITMAGYGTCVADELDDLFKEDRLSTGEFQDMRCLGTLDTLKTYDSWKYTGDDFFIKMFEHKIKRANLGYSDIDASIVDRSYFPQNFPIIRLEDVMLMYAEIVGPTTRARELVNKIHYRATGENLIEDSESVTDDEWQDLVDTERRKELAGEGQRWHDIVRRNTYIECIKNKFYGYAIDKYGNISSQDVYDMMDRVVEGTHLYPIPDTQMKIHDGLYTQNPIY